MKKHAKNGKVRVNLEEICKNLKFLGEKVSRNGMNVKNHEKVRDLIGYFFMEM